MTATVKIAASHGMVEPPPLPRQILFLCTGNYYRSRYAEALFNHLAAAAGLDWAATSRALAIEKGACNVGPISAHTRKGLKLRNIPLADPLPFPQQCCEADLAGAERVFALKEAEHRAYLTQKFPAWPDRVEYWHVHDLDKAPPEQALAEIAEKVAALIGEIRANARSGQAPDRGAGDPPSPAGARADAGETSASL